MNMHLVRIRHFSATNTKGVRVKLTLVTGGNKKSATFGYNYEAPRHGIADDDILAFAGLASGPVNRFAQDNYGDMFAVVMGE